MCTEQLPWAHCYNADCVKLEDPTVAHQRTVAMSNKALRGGVGSLVMFGICVSVMALCNLSCLWTVCNATPN